MTLLRDQGQGQLQAGERLYKPHPTQWELFYDQFLSAQPYFVNNGLLHFMDYTVHYL